MVFILFIHEKITDLLKLTKIDIPLITWGKFGQPTFSIANNEYFLYYTVTSIIILFLIFYLVWGGILKWFEKKINYVSIAFIIIGVSVRFIHYFNNENYYLNVLSFGVAIGFGSIVAYYIRQNDLLSNKFKVMNKNVIRIVYLLIISCCLVIYPLLIKTSLGPFIPLVLCPLFGFVILEQTFSKNSIFKLRKSKLLSRLGKISYSLFVFSSIVGATLIIAFESLDKGIVSISYRILFVVSCFIFTWIISDIYESSLNKLFMRVKRDFKKV